MKDKVRMKPDKRCGGWVGVAERGLIRRVSPETHYRASRGQ